MNNIKLFFRGIKASMKLSPVIYGAFLFFYIFSVIIGIYIVGKYSSNLLAYDGYDESLSTFTIEYRYPDGEQFSKLEKAIEKYSANENVGYVRLRFIDELGVGDDSVDELAKHYWAISYASNEKEMISKYLAGNGTNDIDIESFINSENNAIIVESALTAAEDKIFNIQGTAYTVIQRIYWGENGISYHIVPYKSVVCNDLSIFEITVNYNSISDFAQMTEITSSLSNDFVGAEIKEPVVRDYNVESILSIGNILVYLVIALSAVNFIYIYRYILEKRKRLYDIFFLCGCSKRKVSAFVVAEILLLSISQTIIGLLLFHFAVKPFVTSLEPLLKYTFHIGLYIVVFWVSVLFSFTFLSIEFLFIQKRRGDK